MPDTKSISELEILGAEEMARRIGKNDGFNAASWYFNDPEAGRNQALRLLQGLEDGDPEWLDTLPGSPLSGEFSGDKTPQSLMVEIFGENIADEELDPEVQNEICEIYEEAFTETVGEEIERIALEEARLDIRIKLEVTIDRHDPDKLIADIEEILGKQNVDIGFTEWEED